MQEIVSALFETAVYPVGQYMAQNAITGQAAKPMPARISAWAVYDVFEFCVEFGFDARGLSDAEVDGLHRARIIRDSLEDPRA